VLDAYIIDQIRKREEERRRIYERPAIELPLEDVRPEPKRDRRDEEDEPSRVIVIDL
jgi:hypothetical protein